jgi:hypothetical protein
MSLQEQLQQAQPQVHLGFGGVWKFRVGLGWQWVGGVIGRQEQLQQA